MATEHDDAPSNRKFPVRGRNVEPGDSPDYVAPEPEPEAPPEPTPLPAGTVRLFNRDDTHIDHELPDPEAETKPVQYPFRLTVLGKTYERAGVVDGNETYRESV